MVRVLESCQGHHLTFRGRLRWNRRALWCRRGICGEGIVVSDELEVGLGEVGVSGESEFMDGNWG